MGTPTEAHRYHMSRPLMDKMPPWHTCIKREVVNTSE